VPGVAAAFQAGKVPAALAAIQADLDLDLGMARQLDAAGATLAP
jgi:hypothetical protein